MREENWQVSMPELSIRSKWLVKGVIDV